MSSLWATVPAETRAPPLLLRVSVMLRQFLEAFMFGWRQSRARGPQTASPNAHLAAEADRFAARCDAYRASVVGLDPGAVTQWVSYLEDHNDVLIVGRPNVAVAISQPRPYRVH